MNFLSAIFTSIENFHNYLFLVQRKFTKFIWKIFGRFFERRNNQTIAFSGFRRHHRSGKAVSRKSSRIQDNNYYLHGNNSL